MSVELSETAAIAQALGKDSCTIPRGLAIAAKLPWIGMAQVSAVLAILLAVQIAVETRNRTQEDLIRIWQRRRKTIVFVTHDIGEAVFLADRIVLLLPRPGRIARSGDFNAKTASSRVSLCTAIRSSDA